MHNLCACVYPMCMTNRLHVIVSDKTRGVIEAIKTDTGMTATEQVRKGIDLLNYVINLQKEGNELQVHEKDGDYRQVTVYF